MFQTRVFEFQNGKWEPVMIGFIAECGHWHWYDLKPPVRLKSPFKAINYFVQGSLAEVIRHR